MFDGAVWESLGERDLRVLRAARAEIARLGGWQRGALGLPGVSMCAIGWLSDRAYVEQHPEPYRLVARLLYPALPRRWRLWPVDPHTVVVMFNDVRWRRQRAVVALYDRAIRLAERRA